MRKKKSEALIPAERHTKILDYLSHENILSIKKLTELLNVSHMTVRRDIATLIEEGKVAPIRGGVTLSENGKPVPAPLKRSNRSNINIHLKKGIAEVAARFINDNSIIYLDPGTTTYELIPYIKRKKNLTVVSNDLIIVNDLISSDFHLIHTGGEIDNQTMSSVGPIAISAVQNINFDIYFMSTPGWSLEYGVTSPDIERSQLKQAVLNNAFQTILMADSTKYNSISLAKVCSLDQIDHIVTDQGLENAVAEKIKQTGIPLHLAAPNDGEIKGAAPQADSM